MGEIVGLIINLFVSSNLTAHSLRMREMGQGQERRPREPPVRLGGRGWGGAGGRRQVSVSNSLSGFGEAAEQTDVPCLQLTQSQALSEKSAGRPRMAQ